MWTYTYKNEDELLHYGVKGMKWGVRNKKELKVAKKYAKAGKYQGLSDYYKYRGDEATANYRNNYKVLDKQASAWDKKGNYLMAEIARRQSQKLKDKEASTRQEFDQMAEHYAKKAAKSTEKASAYATKKRVDLGKSKIKEIVSTSSKKTSDFYKKHDTSQWDDED